MVASKESRMLQLVLVVLGALALAVAAQQCASDVVITQTDIDGSVQAYYYATDDSVVFVLSSNNTLYRSTDEGKNWASQNALLMDADVPYGASGLLGVRGVQPLADPNNWVFLGQGPWVWVTSNGGATYQKLDSRKYLRIVPHPTDGQSFLAAWAVYAVEQTDCPDCPVDPSAPRVVLDITRDLGNTTECAGDYIVDFAWLGEERVVILVDDQTGALSSHSLLRSDDLTSRNATNSPFCPTDLTGVLLGIEMIGFEVTVSEAGAHTLWAAQQPCLKKSKTNTCLETADCITLFFSSDLGESFSQPTFPPGATYLQQNGYRLTSLTSTSALVSTINHIDASPAYGNIFVSPNLNDSDAYFSLSLIDETGEAFTPVGGLPGAFLANHFANPKTSDITSVRTGSSGAIWTDLATTDGARLQLHGFATGITMYSVSSAAGLVWGTGNTGDALDVSRIGSTFFSNDSGVTFAQVSSVPEVYETADDGGLLIMAPWAFGEPGTEVFTTKMTYSLDMGTSWQTCDFSASAMRVINIITNHPRNSIRSFLLLGEPSRPTVGPPLSSTLVHLDFSGAQPNPCTPNDYEQWAPPPDGCVNGQHVTIARRKPTATCYNEGATKPSGTTGEPCACGPQDYYCGPCYAVAVAGPYESGKKATCKREKFTTCAGKSCNKKYEGYRPVAGDACQGGFQPEVWGSHCGKEAFGGDTCGMIKKKGGRSNADLVIALVVVAIALALLVIVVFICVFSQRRKGAAAAAAGPAPTREDVIRDTAAPVSLPNSSTSGYARHDDEF